MPPLFPLLLLGILVDPAVVAWENLTTAQEDPVAEVANVVVDQAFNPFVAQEQEDPAVATGAEDPVASQEEDTPDLIFKFESEHVEFENIRLHPGPCDSFDHYCVNIPNGEDGISSLIANFRDSYPHFSESWINFIQNDASANYEAYIAADNLGIGLKTLTGEVEVMSIGLVVDNVYGIDLLNNKFMADMKIYLRDIDFDEGKKLRTFESLFQEAFGNINVVRFENKDDEDSPYTELLEDKWENVRTQARYKDATPVKHAFCSSKYHTRMRLISGEKYKERFGVGLQIANSGAETKPVLDENGDLLHLKAYGARISYDPPNSKFFPFQSNIMDITLEFPRGREMDRIILCVDPHYTGLTLPMEGIMRRDTDTNFLSLIPRITSHMAPPFLGRSFSQMRNPHKEQHRKHITEGNKVVHSATFTLLYLPEYLDGLQFCYTFLFIILTAELMWLVDFPDQMGFDAKMVSQVLVLQSVVNAQKSYLLYSNKLSNVIYLAYCIATAKILTTALMASINRCKDKGLFPGLVRCKTIIFKTMRLVTLLMATFLIPILTLKTDDKTGEQRDLTWLYYLVGFVDFAIMLLFFLKEYIKFQKLKDKVAGTADESVLMEILKSHEPESTWTAEEVGQWIGANEMLKGVSSLTDGELEAIADKFVISGVNGIAFPQVAYDTASLKQDVGLKVGEAILFVHTMEKMRSAVNGETTSEETVTGKDFVKPGDSGQQA